MKGPGLRLDLDVRRLWRCPRCGRQRKAGAEIVTLRCHCTDEGTWMQLVHGPLIKPVPSDEPAVEPEADRESSSI